jgi:paraquat-inducible protein B
MTNKKIQPAMIGVFVVVSVFLFMTAIVIFGGNRFFEKENLVITYFEGSLQGLSVGAPVTYRGVTVGQVKDIKIHIQTNGQPNQKLIIPVLISLSAGKTLIIDTPSPEKETNVNVFLESMCQDGLRAKLKLVSVVTGKRYIDLAFYKNSIPVYRDTLGKHFEIPTLPSEIQQITKILENIDLNELYKKAMHMLNSLEQLSSVLAETLNYEKTKLFIDELTTTTTNLNQLLLQLNSEIPQVLTKVNRGLEQINTLTANGNNLVNSLDRQLPPVVDSFETALNSIDLTARQANNFLAEAGTVLTPSSSLYRSLTAAIQQFQKTARSVEKLSDYVRRNPDTLIFGLQNTGEHKNE